MGLLNTFFIAANDGEAETLAAPLGGPQGFHSGGMTEVDLDTLLEAISGVAYEVIVATPNHYVGEPDEQWLMELRPELRTALLDLPASEVERVAQALAASDEMQGIDPSDLARFITDLTALVRQATSEQRVYFWGSV